MSNENKTSEELPSGEKDPFEYTVTTLHEKEGCKHNFERRGATKLECTKCGVGLIDSPDRPFPIEEINKHYLHLT